MRLDENPTFKNVHILPFEKLFVLGKQRSIDNQPLSANQPGEIEIPFGYDELGNLCLKLCKVGQSFFHYPKANMLLEQFYTYFHPRDRKIVELLEATAIELIDVMSISSIIHFKISHRLLIDSSTRCVIRSFKMIRDPLEKNRLYLSSIISDITFMNLASRISFEWFNSESEKSDFLKILRKKIGFQLTMQEKKIAGFIRAGDTYKQIATSLSISENTVKKHMNNILSKCQCRNSRELLLFCEKYHSIL